MLLLPVGSPGADFDAVDSGKIYVFLFKGVINQQR